MDPLRKVEEPRDMLSCFGQSPSGLRMWATSFLDGGSISFKFWVDDPDELLLLPQENKGSRNEFRDELWKKTCFEAFLTLPDSEDYLEFNGSPSGDYALYKFLTYRMGCEAIKYPQAAPQQFSSQELSNDGKTMRVLDLCF